MFSFSSTRRVLPHYIIGADATLVAARWGYIGCIAARWGYICRNDLGSALGEWLHIKATKLIIIHRDLIIWRADPRSAKRSSSAFSTILTVVHSKVEIKSFENALFCNPSLSLKLNSCPSLISKPVTNWSPHTSNTWSLLVFCDRGNSNFTFVKVLLNRTV